MVPIAIEKVIFDDLKPFIRKKKVGEAWSSTKGTLYYLPLIGGVRNGDKITIKHLGDLKSFVTDLSLEFSENSNFIIEYAISTLSHRFEEVKRMKEFSGSFEGEKFCYPVDHLVLTSLDEFQKIKEHKLTLQHPVSECCKKLIHWVKRKVNHSHSWEKVSGNKKLSRVPTTSVCSCGAKKVTTRVK